MPFVIKNAMPRMVAVLARNLFDEIDDVASQSCVLEPHAHLRARAGHQVPHHSKCLAYCSDQRFSAKRRITHATVK